MCAEGHFGTHCEFDVDDMDEPFLSNALSSKLDNTTSPINPKTTAKTASSTAAKVASVSNSTATADTTTELAPPSSVSPPQTTTASTTPATTTAAKLVQEKPILSDNSIKYNISIVLKDIYLNPGKRIFSGTLLCKNLSVCKHRLR